MSNEQKCKSFLPRYSFYQTGSGTQSNYIAAGQYCLQVQVQSSLCSTVVTIQRHNRRVFSCRKIFFMQVQAYSSNCSTILKFIIQAQAWIFLYSTIFYLSEVNVVFKSAVWYSSLWAATQFELHYDTVFIYQVQVESVSFRVYHIFHSDAGAECQAAVSRCRMYDILSFRCKCSV